MKYLDLTHTFTSKMPVYPGDPIPKLYQSAFIDQDGFNDTQIQTGMHVGTHIDAPLHMIKNGKKICDYKPDHFFGRGCLIDARSAHTIDENFLKRKKIKSGDIVIILTGFYKKFRKPEYFETYPEITKTFAKQMVDAGVKIVGMDTLSPDRPPFAIHKLFLKNDILIIENLTNLEKLLKYKNFSIIALPAKFDAQAAPIRVVAEIP